MSTVESNLEIFSAEKVAVKEMSCASPTNHSNPFSCSKCVAKGALNK